MSLVTIDLDSEIGRPQSYRQASDNHVIHHSGVESNAQVRNLKLVVNPRPPVGEGAHKSARTHTCIDALRKSWQDAVLSLKGFGGMFIFVSD